MSSPGVAAARRIADEVLFPAAVAVDGAQAVPAEVFDAIAREGFYALGGQDQPNTPEGPVVPDDQGRAAVIEAFAGGCLSAAFVWLQHRGALGAVTTSSNPVLRESFLQPMRRGRVRGGLAIGAATRPGPPPIRARRDGDGWTLSGTAPWVTGWGMIDVLLMAARDRDDRLVWALVDAGDAPALRAEPLQLIAVQASGTVTLTVEDLHVPDARVVATEPHADYLARDAESLSTNGFLAVGVAGRAIALLEGQAPAAGLADELADVRSRLLQAPAEEAPAARAAASDLALRAAAALAVHQGSRSVLRDSHAARLIREATFLLTFGTRPAIRTRLLDRLAAGWPPQPPRP